MVGLGSTVKERGTVVHARITEREYALLRDISLLGGERNPLKVNISEGIRFCVQFTAKCLALLPDVVMESVIELKEKELEELKKERRKGNG